MAERFARGAAPADHALLAEPYARLSAPVRAHAEALDRSLEDRVPNMFVGGGAMGPVGASGDSGAHGRSWVQDRRLALAELAQTPRFSRLPETEQRALLDRVATDGRWLSSNVSPLIAQGHWGQLGDEAHASLLDRLSNSSVGGRELAAMLGSSRGKELSGAERNQLARIFAKSHPSGDESLNRILWSDLGGQPLLRSRAPGGRRLIDELERFAESKLDPRLRRATPGFNGSVLDARFRERLDQSERGLVLADLMSEVARPMESVEQRNRGTCTVTSFLTNLARRSPAEYARIATDLATSGRSQLSSGTTVQVPTDAFACDASRRSVTERLTQAAMMQVARPGDTYRNRHPGPDGRHGTPDDGTQSHDGRSPDGFIGANRTGLLARESVRVLDALHGRDHQARRSSAFDLLGRRMWGESLDELARQKLAQGSPVFASLDWDEGAHMLEVVAVEGGRVLLRNPWGGKPSASALPSPQPARAAEGGPPSRRIVDPRTGLESVSIEDFRTYGNSVIAAGP